MIDWVQNLPVVWMTIVVFCGTYLTSGVIWWAVMKLATGQAPRAFKSISPGMLSPLGIIFGLFLCFVAAQVWGDVDRAKTAVSHEASVSAPVDSPRKQFPR